tara:strand:- start:1762 stop:1935 length:174 start_codon:yes stop_codon:yes gene_type:complete
MKQSYIEIFENTGGNITVKYAIPSDEQTLDIQTIEIKHDDLSEIAHHFLYLAEMAGE